MKTTLALATASLSAVSANFSFGACKTFTDLGMTDTAMTLSTIGTETYMEVFRTTDTANEIWGDCINSSYIVDGTKTSERVKGWFWYAFFSYVTNDIKTQWDTTKSSGYQSLSLMDTDYSQTHNIKHLPSAADTIVQYMCVNTFWGIGKNEYVWYKIKKTQWDSLKAAGTDFGSTIMTP